MKIALFMDSFVGGGEQRAIVNLAKAMANTGNIIDIVCLHKEGPYLYLVPDNIRVVTLRVRKSFLAVGPLAAYFRLSKPDVVMSTLTRCNVCALLAQRIAFRSLPVLVKEATTPSLAYQNNKSMRTWILKKAASWTYPMAGSIIAVSKAAAEDMTRFFQLPPEKITILYNPVVTSDMLDKAELPSGHRWLDRADRPVVLSVGRLVSEKDHATLLKAFAIAKRDIPCRLIILGEGPERQNLVELAKSLEISSDFDLPGFVDNPFAWMSKASLFVSASRREGLPNSIIEAMACGLPVVSTDCPSGPREILNGGRLGSLVKVGDVDSLAKSMIQGLESPISSETLKESVAKYNDHLISNRYLSLFAETRNKALKRQ